MNIINKIKDSWGWTGIEPVEIVGENDFGNLMVKDTQNRYWRICPEDVYCEIIASNQTELNEISTNQEFLEDWYMQALVEQAEEKLGTLTEGYKYHLVIPGALGGEYNVSNIKTVPLTELI